MRGRIFIACAILVLAPLATAWLVGIYDRFDVRRIRGSLERTASLLASEVASRGFDERQAKRAASEASGDGREGFARAGPDAWLDEFGKKHGVLIRVLDQEGHVLASTDSRFGEGRISQSWWFRSMADFWYGPEGPPDLIAFEAELGPESERPEVREVLLTGKPAELVRTPERANMYVVYRAFPAQDRIVYLTRVSRRGIRALSDLRFQLMKLTLGLLVGGLAMGIWLVFSIVDPLIALERRVRAAIGAGAAERLALDRDDEIGDLSKNFDALATRLAERAERTARVAADFAHDLKNPIAAVVAAAELLESEKPLDEERRRRLARAADEAAQHMRRSVDAMLALARLDEALAREARETVDLAALAEQIVERYRADPRSDRLQLELSIEGAPVIRGNAERIGQLFDNLIENALIFARSKIVVRVAAGCVVEIADDGPGVSAGNRDKIFQRFFTARPEGSEPGSGLGLSIVEHVARAHGGSVALVGEGPGAIFRVELPAL